MLEHMDQIRQAKIVNLCIYSTKWYCYEPSACHKIMRDGPLIIDNFPKPGCKLTCYFGEIPEYFVNLKYSIDGYGLKRRDEIFTQRPHKKKTEDYIAELKSDPNYFPRYTWATSIAIEKPIDLIKQGMIGENGKINISKAHEYMRKSYAEVTYSEVFDKIILAFSTEMEPIFFDEVLLSEIALLIDNEIVVAYPKNMATHEEGWQCYEGDIFNKDRISSLIRKLNTPNCKWLGNIAHWRSSMMIERDPWKKFYFGFICLEMLIHKSFKNILSQNQFDVIMNSESQHFNKTVKMPFEGFVPTESDCRKLPLMMKFTLVSGVLNPKSCRADIAAFKDCKDFRDKMSHEGIYKRDKLPIEKLEALLDFYLRTILKKM
jgi:hypothetical protein